MKSWDETYQSGLEFNNVTCQFLEGELPELLKDSPHRRHRSLYVEAKKRIS
jgi:hypothetical protein